MIFPVLAATGAITLFVASDIILLKIKKTDCIVITLSALHQNSSGNDTGFRPVTGNSRNIPEEVKHSFP